MGGQGGAAAGGVAGGQAAHEPEIMADRALLTINAAMRSERDRIAVRLISGMRLPVAEHPLPVALSDLDACQRAGSVLGALTALNQAAGRKAQTQRERLGDRRGEPLPPTAHLGGGDGAGAHRGARADRRGDAQGQYRASAGHDADALPRPPRGVAQHVVIAREPAWQPE